MLINISRLLKKHQYTLATAESCTGGLLAHTLTNIPGSSEYFDRGIVSYSNKAKTELLGVSEHMLKEYGAVSAEVATEMAERVRIISEVDIGLATTGIAGPSGGTKEKPVGLVYIGMSTTNNTKVQQYQFSGNRLENKTDTVNAVLTMLQDHLIKE